MTVKCTSYYTGAGASGHFGDGGYQYSGGGTPSGLPVLQVVSPAPPVVGDIACVFFPRDVTPTFSGGSDTPVWAVPVGSPASRYARVVIPDFDFLQSLSVVSDIVRIDRQPAGRLVFVLVWVVSGQGSVVLYSSPVPGGALNTWTVRATRSLSANLTLVEVAAPTTADEYWRVEVSTGGSAVRVVAVIGVADPTQPLEFATILPPNAAPAIPTLVAPTNAAIDRDTSQRLSWSAPGATSLEVYFGLTNPPPIVFSGPALIADYAPGHLAVNSTYYWKIVATNKFGSTAGPIWSFTTAAVETPVAAPTVAARVGTGIEAGVHSYGYSFVQGALESHAGPTAAVTHSAPTSIADPVAAPTAIYVAGTGLSVDVGAYKWAVTFLGASGETLPSPLRTLNRLYEPAPTLAGLVVSDSAFVGNLMPSATYLYKLAYVTGGPSTPVSSYSAPISHVVDAGGHQVVFSGHGGPQGSATFIYLYRTHANGSSYFLFNSGGGTGSTADISDGLADANLTSAAPTIPTAMSAQIGVPLGPAGTVSRRIYRTVAGGSQLKLVATLADNTTTSYTDSTADGSLGANAPTSSTAISAATQQTSVSAIAVGPGGTTARKLYRTIAGGAQLKLLATLADNVTTIYTDATADGSLGADAP